MHDHRLRGFGGRFGKDGRFGGLGPVYAVVQIQFRRAGLSVPEFADDFEHFRPGRVRPIVGAFVRGDSHDEEELLGCEFAFFSGLDEIGSSPAWTAPAFEAGPGFIRVLGCASLSTAAPIVWNTVRGGRLLHGFLLLRSSSRVGQGAAALLLIVVVIVIVIV
jgi:hypothetical protein